MLRAAFTGARSAGPVWQGEAVHRLLVTGVSGAGKSTIARQLRAWGHHALSADADTVLCGWYDVQRRRVTRPAHPAAAWLAVHQWEGGPGRLDEIIAEAERVGAASLWLCGQAGNALCSCWRSTSARWPRGWDARSAATTSAGSATAWMSPSTGTCRSWPDGDGSVR